MNFGITPSLLCYLLDPLTNKCSRVRGSIIKFVDRFQDLSKESSFHQDHGLIIMYTFQEEICQGI